MLKSDISTAPSPRCLCGFCKVTTGCIIIGVLEIILVCHMLIFAVSNMAAGEEAYRKANPDFCKVVVYDYLKPFLVIQIVWLVSAILMIVGVKVPLHWLIAPHLATQCAIILGGTMALVVTLVNMQHVESLERLELRMILIIAVTVAVTLAQVYVTVVVCQCFRYLMQQRKSILEEQQLLNHFRYRSAGLRSVASASSARPTGRYSSAPAFSRKRTVVWATDAADYRRAEADGQIGPEADGGGEGSGKGHNSAATHRSSASSGTKSSVSRHSPAPSVCNMASPRANLPPIARKSLADLRPSSAYDDEQCSEPVQSKADYDRSQRHRHHGAQCHSSGVSSNL